MTIQQALHEKLNKRLCLAIIPAGNMNLFTDTAQKPVYSMLAELAAKIVESLSDETKSHHNPPITTYWVFGQLKRHFKNKHVYNEASRVYTSAGNELLTILRNLHAIFHGEYRDDARNLHSVEQIGLIAEKLCEEIGECTEGFHDRVNIVWSSLFVPRSFTERLYLIRHQIVQQVADTLAAEFCAMQKTAEAHVHNHITVIAHTLGCGTAIENRYDTSTTLSETQRTRVKATLIQSFKEKFTPLLIIQQIENQLHDQLLGLGYESRRIEQGYNNAIYNRWPDFLNGVFPKAIGEDRDFTYWFIMDSAADTDTDTDTDVEIEGEVYADIKVLDLDWRKIREAIYSALVKDNIIINAPKKINDLDCNPENRQEYAYWISKMASPDDLNRYLAKKQTYYQSRPVQEYTKFLIEIALLAPKEQAFYVTVVEKLATNQLAKIQTLLQTITNSELLADFMDRIPDTQWPNIDISLVFQYFVTQKNPTLLQQFLMHVPYSVQLRVSEQIRNPSSDFLKALSDSLSKGPTLYPHLLHIIAFCTKHKIVYPADIWLNNLQWTSVGGPELINRIITAKAYIEVRNLLELMAILYSHTGRLVPWDACITAAFMKKPALIGAILGAMAAHEPSPRQRQLLTSIQPNLIHRAIAYAPESLSCILPYLEKLGQKALIREQIFERSTDPLFENVLHRLWGKEGPLNAQAIDKLLGIIPQYLSKEDQQTLFAVSFSWKGFLSKQPSLEQIDKFFAWQRSLNIPLDEEDRTHIQTFYLLDPEPLMSVLQERTDHAEKYLRMQLALTICLPEKIIGYVPILVEYFPDQLADLLLSSGMHALKLLELLNSPFNFQKKCYRNVLDYILQHTPDTLVPYLESVSHVTEDALFLIIKTLEFNRIKFPQTIMQIWQIFKERARLYSLSQADKQHINDCLSNEELCWLFAFNYRQNQPGTVIDILRIFKEKGQTYHLSREDKLHLNRLLSAADWYTICAEGLIPASVIKEKKEIILQHIVEMERHSGCKQVIQAALNPETNLGTFFGTQRGFFKCRRTAGTWKKLDQMLTRQERTASSPGTSF